MNQLQWWQSSSTEARCKWYKLLNQKFQYSKATKPRTTHGEWLSMVKLIRQQARVKHLQTLEVPSQLTFLMGSTIICWNSPHVHSRWAKGHVGTTKHRIYTADQQIIFLGLSAERTVTVTIKEGKMLSSHRTNQTKKYCSLTQSEDPCFKATKARPASTPPISKHGLFCRKLECAFTH